MPTGRTANPRFKRLITGHEPHLLFSPTDELEWAADAADRDDHLPALLLSNCPVQHSHRRRAP
ncbi:hypothetical protein [Streptomyces sp. NPDC092952]|uniref:hypothetical protein n=1 Tax=Streptomyces sp. NPDC092952 TaxID=3366018 RepID=UPI00380EEEC8